ncbi:ABC-2 type transporter [Desulfarculus baarsii DSM 2075]|uniref:Transport permease protein n=1 Tax=Desulfarculus baarsii (strain ATCC 33931 / DSM 2075 / LMG 7858 / VKM B-1802 / 2st14) TaxID=644282 RepID=E1QM71_DESB2|nr:ABC transporter permease [Desulfarculus baarsii]ADK86656.1 ABC-2 type transporter [Desulfarculus baarsii DSM 2075]
MLEIQHISQLWRHRALVWALTGRELKGRYRGSVLGFLWTFLNPLLLLLVYSLVFSVYFRVEMEHYSVFMFTGLLPWIFFSQSLLDGAGAVVDAGSLVTKVTFPMQVLPANRVLVNFVNFLLSLPVLVVFLLASGKGLSWHWALFPAVALAHLLFTFSLALVLCTACVFLRDTRHILGNLITLWFFLTPILYPLSSVPAQFRWLALFNPATIFTMAYQDICFWGRQPRWDLLGLMVLISLVFLAVGIRIFEAYKEYFAEKI